MSRHDAIYGDPLCECSACHLRRSGAAENIRSWAEYADTTRLAARAIAAEEALKASEARERALIEAQSELLGLLEHWPRPFGTSWVRP